MILTFLSAPEVLKYWKLIGFECIWYPASFELDYPSIAVDFESQDEAIRQSSAVHYVADDDVWLVSGAGHYLNDNQSPWKRLGRLTTAPGKSATDVQTTGFRPCAAYLPYH